ncbi:Cna B-type domain-containing protein [Peptostreptococcus sp. D1]|uniref:Cna B-type domain-containing protein n=1 Tax=Peptostreptococcus sp. D1 TaxID=72304 RepID=UPI0008E8166B|nr:Cna B-type domain-containing protein [Peptostreptococcus sp. D1]SFE65029.1 LPXTG-motif cell wall anchor domain-containing protein/conserved repeat domain-containing protein [Peptostreptococcus sp. D1]
MIRKIRKLVSLFTALVIIFNLIPMSAVYADDVGLQSSGGVYAKRQGTFEESAKLKDFVYFADWSKATNLAEDGSVQEGTELVVSPAEGYEITVKVTKLAPFRSTEIYRDRLIEKGYDPEASGYDPNAKNVDYRNNSDKKYYPSELSDRWGRLLKGSGYNTGNAKVVLQPNSDVMDSGITFSLSAKMRGKEIPVHPIILDGESISDYEVQIITTDGGPFRLIDMSRVSEDIKAPTISDISTLSTQVPVHTPCPKYKWDAVVNDSPYAGQDTQVVGPYITQNNQLTPFFVSQNAKTISSYNITYGQQGITLGFVIGFDSGDAESSYGTPLHFVDLIASSNSQEKLDTLDSHEDATLLVNRSFNSPFLGSVKPDTDDITNSTDERWTYDDTHDALDVKGDEGEQQLTGDKYPTFHLGTDEEYILPVIANLNGADSANVSAWIDFNQNGTFDETERVTSHVSEDGVINLNFGKRLETKPTDTLNARVRIATQAEFVESPTGLAPDGEVEDFQIPAEYQKTRDVKVTKKWVGKEGSSATIELYADKSKVDTVTLNKENNWQHTFTDLDKYKDGEEIIYTVKEVKIDSYDTEITGDMTSGFVVTNTNTEKISIPVTKQWVGKPTDSVKVKLLADNAEKETVTLNAKGEWKHTFTDLLKYDKKDGHEIVYSIEEVNIEGYTTGITGTSENGFTITNTITGKVSVPVTKKWVGKEGASATIELYADKSKVDTVTLNKENNWQHTFTDLDKYKDGEEIIYTVKEVKIDNYDTEITGDMTSGFVVTNTNTEKISVPVTKKWVGKEGASATIELYADKSKVDTVTLNKENNWQHTFTDLDKYKDGEEITYTVKEVKIDNYDTEITGDMTNGFVVTNTNTEKISMPVTKKWIGPEKDSVTVKLLADGKEVSGKTLKLNKEGDWKGTFKDLPKYNKDGSEIKYDVAEVNIAFYESNKTGDAKNGFVITNKHIPPKKEVFKGSNTTNIDGETVQPGQELTYAITYKNTTDKDVKATITDKIPTHTKFVSADNEGKEEGGVVTWKVDVTKGQSVTVKFTVKVDSDVNGAPLNNKAKVNDGNNEADTNEVNNPTPKEPVKEVLEFGTTTKIDGKRVEAGQKITYSITYENTTGKDADVTIIDKIPSHTKFVSADNEGKEEGGSVIWKKKVTKGGTLVVTFTVQVDENVNGETIKNKAKANDGNNDYDTNEVTNPTPTKPKKEVFEGNTSINIDGKAVKPGQELTYAITYKNTTGEDVEAIITDKLPAHTTFVSADNEGKEEGGVVTWKANVKDGKSITVKFTVKVDKDVNGEAIDNQAKVNDGKHDYNTNQTHNPTTTVPKKEVFEGDTSTNIDGEAVKPGQELTYTITYKNTKGKEADVIITDKIPAHTEFISADNGGNNENGIVTWKKKVAEGETLRVSFKVKVSGDVKGEVLKNTAKVNDGEGDFDTNEVTNPTPTPPTKKVFKGIDTTDIDGKEVKVGETLTYKVSYHNTTGKGQKVVIEDKIPEFTSYVEGSADNNGVYKDGKIIWTKENVAAGETFEVTFKVKVEKSASGKTLINEALVRAGKNESKTNKITNPVPEIPPTPPIDEPKKPGTLPKTGDGANLSLYAGLILLSGSVLIVLGIRRREKTK